MSNRITEAQLQLVVDRINSVMGAPRSMFVDGEYSMRTEGHYYLDYANGGVALEQTGKVTRHGQGCRNVFDCGHVPKRELYGLMQAYIDGVRDYRVMIQQEGQ